MSKPKPPPKPPKGPVKPGGGKKGRPRKTPEQAGTCGEPGCGRPAYAREVCQTHHRQLITTGKLKPIRPYRPRSPGTVKFSGLRLSPQCAAQVEAYAQRNRMSLGAAIAFILEEWLVKR